MGEYMGTLIYSNSRIRLLSLDRIHTFLE